VSGSSPRLAEPRRDRPRPSEAGARFRPEERIRRRTDFERIYRSGARVHGRFSTVFVLGNQGSVARLGIAATRKLGGAVLRNRAKRLIRDVFRRHKIGRGVDVVVVPRRELFDASLTAIEADYLSSIERASRRR
jgi:ribonuclease P protein component